MRTRWATARRAAALLVVGMAFATAAHAEAPGRSTVLLDSSGSMLLTPEIVTFPETCVVNNFNACTASGNPTPAQESCNACVAWTVRQSAGCTTSWTSSCRTTYGNCWRFFNGGTGCGQSLNVADGVTTRGDGSALTPGCDVDGDGVANDSRVYQAKEALRAVAGSTPVELALWRFAQVEGGQTCAGDATCPDTPGGLSELTCEVVGGQNRCVLDSALLGSMAGQCAPATWNGASSSFACSQCSDAGSERLLCEAYSLGAIRTGGPSPLTGTVNCQLPSPDHPYLASHGAFFNNGACDPSGGERLVDFPAPGGGGNLAAIEAWIDHLQPNLGVDVELVAQGGSPVAAALRDVRTALLATLAADIRTPCRKYNVVLVLDGADTCEPGANAPTAAASLQNLSFTNPLGVPVTGFDVPVHVVGFAACPPGTPNCPTAQDMNAIAAAGGTGSAVFVSSQAELQSVLAALTAEVFVAESCNGVDDDCDGAVDEGFPDTDGDAVADCRDNCPTLPNPPQADTDGDLVGDACDNCPTFFNPDGQHRRFPRCR